MSSEKANPQLYEKFKSTIDLSTIESNIEKGVYIRPALFDADMNRLFANSIKYCGNESWKATESIQLQTIYVRKKAEVYDKLVAICGESADLRTLLENPNENHIRCICGPFNDEGVMIQCSKCKRSEERSLEKSLRTPVKSNISVHKSVKEEKMAKKLQIKSKPENVEPKRLGSVKNLFPKAEMNKIETIVCHEQTSKEEIGRGSCDEQLVKRVDEYLSSLRRKSSRISVKSRLGSRDNPKLDMCKRTANTLLRKWRTDFVQADAKILKERAHRFKELKEQLPSTQNTTATSFNTNSTQPRCETIVSNPPRYLNEIKVEAADEIAASPEAESELHNQISIGVSEKATEPSIADIEAAQTLIRMNEILPQIGEKKNVNQPKLSTSRLLDTPYQNYGFNFPQTPSSSNMLLTLNTT